MRHQLRISALLLIVTALSGCCPNGCFLVTGEAYEKLANPTPYIFKWAKPGTTEEDRYQASKECGGGNSSHAPLFPPSELKAMRRPEESENDAYARRFYEFERCLIRKGYHFTGQCYDNEISRSSPACGAP